MQFKHLFGASLAVVAARAQSENATAPANLTSLLGSSQNLTALTTLLSAYPSLAGQLANATNITIFAPSNAALEALNSSTTFQAAAAQSGFVEAFLMYHVLAGTFYAENITETPAFPQTLLNDTVYTNVTGGQVVEVRVEDSSVYVISGLKNNVTVIEPNLNFTGGVVHIIDGLLTIPPSVAAAAQEAGLTAFLGAVNATNLTEAVSTTPDLTIFAPINSAFQDIASALANLTVEEAASILEYHVINGTVAYSSTLTNGTVPALAGGNLTITVEDGEVFVNRARVINADILLANGVLHIIDSVLSPNDTAAGNSTQEGAQTAYPGASSDTVVPYTSGVPTATSSNAALATTNDAVASGYATNTGSLGANSAGNPTASAMASSSSAGAAMATAGIGAAALFGGAAFLAGY